MIETGTTQNERIEAIKEEIRLAAQAPGDRVFVLLRRLKTKVDAEKNHALSGFLYYSYAYAYSFRDDHASLIKYLELAVHHLLRAKQPELLARSYNLFAIEAQNYGCFEVAFDYFSIAASLVQDEKESLALAYIEANTGDLLAQMGDYRLAVSHIEKSIPIVEKHSEDVWSVQNTALGLVNLAMCHLLAGDLKKTERVLRRVEKLLKKANPEQVESARQWYTLGCARLAVAQKDKKRIGELSEAVRKQVIEGDNFGEFIREILYYCEELIAARELKMAEEVIHSIDRMKITSEYLLGFFMQCKIDYCRMVGDFRKMMRFYEERHRLYEKQQEIQRMVYLESIDFMHLLEELRQEEALARQENTILQQRAETDALTGLPNRYAMNRQLEEAFLEAEETGQKVGIGIADINDFKKYNDTFGHAEGDCLLQQIAAALRSMAKEEDLSVFRYGGDEFVFIYRNMDDKDIRRIDAMILKETDGKLSHGFYNAVPTQETKIWDFLAEADKRLYRRKKRRS
ncbi:MAG: GGDEF domain-containing protein [Lachnospiraceae bacterium]|nr:GGDEF domain-containing protein [Lachnospiraceae bacterium]